MNKDRLKSGLFSVMAFILVIPLLLTGCGGGGGSSSSGDSGSTLTASLKVANKVSVVDAKTESDGASVAAMTIGHKAVSALPASSDYKTDESFVYVQERSAESFEMINEILCMMGQTGYDKMLNKGDYIAMIDTDQCDSEKGDASSAGQASQNQSSGANATEYERWTVNSSRADSDSAQIVKVWVHEKGEDHGGGMEPPKTIEVKTTITESSSTTNPYGIFSMSFRGYPDGFSSQTFFSGGMSASRDSASGKVLLKFYENFDFGGMELGEEKVTLDRASDGSSGGGSVFANHSSSWGSEQKGFNVAFNNDYFYRSDGSNNVCLSRSNPDVSAWRYGMYNDELHSDPGSRVKINSGFPLKYNDGTNDYHGWVGYHGLWFPEDVTIANNATVYKQVYGSNGTTETPYTVFVAGGKLKKHTKKMVDLGDIKNVPLSRNECQDTGGGNWSCTDYRVVWNGANLVRNATRDQSTNWVWKDIIETTITFGTNDWDFHFWSEALGGNGRIMLRDNTGNPATLSDTTKVIFHLENTVYPGETVPSALACFENCPDPSVIDTTDPYFVKSTFQSMSSFSNINQSVAPSSLIAGDNYIAYSFDSTTMELKQSGSAAVMTNNTNSQWGVMTGALFDPTVPANITALECDWYSGSTCTWDIWNELDVFYTWETGTDNWNKLTALMDGSTVVPFDPPMSVEYTHTRNDNSTAKYYLEYNGFGDFHGIPGKCVDMDTGNDTDCFDSGGTKFIRWVPEITIPDGAAVYNASNNTMYYVKALEKEERMKAVVESDCTNSGLSIQSYALPASGDFVAPDIGTEPAVTGAPAVIGGEVQ